jgi:Leucine-rich repeat (LRR) protein
LTVFSFFSRAQFNTAIIDSNFEQSLINLGYDSLLDGSVFTASISEIDSLDVSFQNISNLSGLQNFVALQYLNCSNNNIDTLIITQSLPISELYCSSNNMLLLNVDGLDNLDVLDCSFNNITSLNLSQNIELDSLRCSRNQLTELYVNTTLAYMYCGDNKLTSLDLSSLVFGGLVELECQNNPINFLNIENNYSLKHLICQNNALQHINLEDNINLNFLSILNNAININNNDITHLDLSANCNLTNLYVSGNINLYCIQVCDTAQANTWISNLDNQHYYSNNCNYTNVNDILYSKNKLISIKDIYGKVSFKKTNSLLFFIYQYGRVEKRIFLD